MSASGPAEKRSGAAVPPSGKRKRESEEAAEAGRPRRDSDRSLSGFRLPGHWLSVTIACRKPALARVWGGTTAVHPGGLPEGVIWMLQIKAHSENRVEEHLRDRVGSRVKEK